jgi:hypothetical protein
MPAIASNPQWLKRVGKSWLVLAQGALWLGGILGTFLLAPPVGGLSTEAKIWLRLGQFIMAVLLGLVFLAARRWQQQRHAFWWAGLSLLCLLAAVGAFFRYQQLTLAWTGNYTGQRIVVGSELTSHGRSYMQANPDVSRDQLLMDVAGQTETIWTADSINSRRLVLAATYIICLPLFTLCLIAVVQAVHCGSATIRARRARRSLKTPSIERPAARARKLHRQK